MARYNRTPAHYWPHTNKGTVLLIMLLIVLAAFSTFIVSALSSSNINIQKQKQTIDSLAHAKEALLSYASTYERPGALPCPDTNDDGSGNPNGNTDCYSKIGRLPWKQLGLPDLRDGNGERLWYAVSTDFANVPSTKLINNEESLGQLNICSPNGCGDPSPIPTPPTTAPLPVSNLAAIVFSPGIPIDGNNRQNGTDLEPDPTVNIDPAKKALNYLDKVTINSNEFNNSTGSTNGNDFIAGNSSATFNDKLLGISAAEIFSNVNKRMETKTTLVEIAACIVEYGNHNSTPSDRRLPWSTPLSIIIIDTAEFVDSVSLKTGRLPFNVSKSAAQPPTHNWGTNLISTAKRNTFGACSSFPKWWESWKPYLYYAVASNFSPDNATNSAPSPNSCLVPTGCLSVNGGVGKFAAVVIFSGKKLSNQIRTDLLDKKKVENYLEEDNFLSINNSGTNFTNSAPSATFNDTIVCIKPDMSISPDCT